MTDLAAAGGAPGASQVAFGSGNVQIRDVVGSHIEVTITGEKLLVPLEPALVPVGERARSPALLVKARSGVVPFTVRADLADKLEAWLTTDEAFSGVVVGGRGGSGKTRLAVELCERARRKSMPLSGLLARIAGESALGALVTTKLPRLVVVDYAETRAEQLEILLPQLAAGATEQAPVRVLMLIRASSQGTSDWAERLRGRSDWLDARLEECDTYTLEDAPLDTEERAQLFAGAAQAFVKSAGRSNAPPQPAPPLASVLEGEAFATPLMVVIAAYLGVHGERLPVSRDALFDGILEHEERYWRATGGDLFTPASKLPRRAAALATLCAAETSAAAVEHLRLLPQLAGATGERLDDISEWARGLYPGAGWWSPLEPDRIGEHLIATMFTNEPGIIAAVLANGDPGQITWPLTILSRAAADHPEFRDALRPVLAASLHHLCELAVKQASSTTVRELIYGEAATAATAIENAITTIPVDPDALLGPVGLMPAQANLILSSLAVTLARQHVQHQQRLAEANPAAYEPALATSLSNFSVDLANAGQREQALDAAQRGVEIYERLAKADPAAYEPYLASSLNNLSTHLSEAGEREQALDAAQRAVEIYERLAQASPADYEPYLAISLKTLSIRLSEAGEREQALDAAQRAVEINERLAQASPAAYEPDLAGSLHTLSIRLSGAGEREQALDAAQRAVEIYEHLAAASPAAYEFNLARSLNILSNLLSGAGEREQALDAIQRAVEINERLAQASPAAYEPDLAISLNNLSNRLSESGEREQALDAAQRGVEIYERLAKASPAAYEPYLAISLKNLSIRLSGAGEREQALDAAQRAVEIYQRLAKATPAMFGGTLSTRVTCS